VSAGLRRAAPFGVTRWVRYIFALGFVAIVTLVVTRWAIPLTTRFVSGFRSNRPELRELVAAAASEPNRSVEGRLSGGFKYAPPSSAVRGTDRAIEPDVRIAAAKIEKLHASGVSVEREAALGTAYIVLGDVADAIATLENVASVKPDDPYVLNDLAVAYLARARRAQRADDLPRAASFASRAVKANPHLAEAWFNRALAFEMLGPAAASRDAWADYLKIDNASPWAREGRQHVVALDEHADKRSQNDWSRFGTADLTPDLAAQMAAERPSAARRLAEDVLLPEWAALTSAGEHRNAARSLEKARTVAAALANSTGDRYTSDLLDELRLLLARPDKTADVVVSVRAYARAQELIGQNQPSAALSFLEQSARAFQPLNGPHSLRIGLGRLYVGWYTRPPTALVTPLTALESVVDAKDYFFMSGGLHLLHASVMQRLARFGEAVSQYETAIRYYERAGETEFAANARMLLASSYSEQGDYEDAWKQEQTALTVVDGVRSLNQRHNILKGAVRLAVRQELPLVALYYQSLLTKEARARNEASTLFESVHELADIYSKLGSTADASSAIAEAKQLYSRIPDPGVRLSFKDSLLMSEADVLRRIRPAEALEAANEAVRDMERSGSVFLLTKAYLALGRAEAANGSDDRAIDAWRRGAEVFEDQRPSVRDEQIRISHLSDVWELYGELIRHLSIRGDTYGALNVAEHARARVLLDSLSTTQRATVKAVADVQSKMNPETVMLVYDIVESNLYIWALSRDGCIQRRVPLTGPDQLSTLVQRVRAAIDSRRETVDLRALYQLLIDPVRDIIRPRRRIVIVPDGPLWVVPFAALIGPGGRYLLEDYELMLTPSLSLYLSATEALQGGRAANDALVVGDPTFAQADYPRLAHLAGASAEAVAVSSIYRKAVSLIGSNATRKRFVFELTRHGVVHFAGHAVEDPDFPSRSFMLLAGDSGDGRLVAGDISRLNMSRVSLVVLAACDTLGGQISRGEGGLSLSRPFLAAGVPQIVGTLWDVTDADTRILVAFHRLYAKRVPAIEALRVAQLEALRQRDRQPSAVGHWAAFQLIGGLEDKRVWLN
jgi:CHAT domain-containing protein/tetratricopeptide (TPR) repeat protein